MRIDKFISWRVLSKTKFFWVIYKEMYGSLKGELGVKGLNSTVW